MTFTSKISSKLAARFAIPLDMEKGEFFQTVCAASWRRIGLSLGRYDSLTRLAAKYRSDKGVTHFPFHGYTLYYASLFERFQGKRIKLLEIGLARRGQRRSGMSACPSLSMWLEFFPEAEVYGFDIDDFTNVRLPRTHIFQGDQGSSDDLRCVLNECGSFDIIIDDGSHASYHQRITLETLFPHLTDQGIYVVEDVHWQPKELEASLPITSKMRDLARDRETLEELAPGVRTVQHFKSPIKIANEKDMGEMLVLSKA